MLFVIVSAALHCLAYRSVLVNASLDSQVTLGIVHDSERTHLPPEWAQPPSSDATGRLIFNSISSLPLRWPNTMWKNGHTIAPAKVPVGTMLYHGTYVSDGTAPTESGWLGFDPEVGYLYCGNPCRVASYVATRELKVLYFDGLSAAKVPNSSYFETQDLLSWGSIRHDRIFWELERLKVLCDWGREFSIDGFVRMQAEFELMHCDFTDGIEMIELADLPPQFPILLSGHGQPPRPPGWKGELVTGTQTFVEAFLSGQRHDQLPGEARVRISFDGIISFYDPALSSLTEARRGKSRAHHNLQDISQDDISTTLQELRSVLTRNGRGSGVDWPAIFQGVYDRYADRLQLLNLTLGSADATLEHMTNARQLILALLVHHMAPTDVPSPGQSDISWMSPVVERCSRSPVTHVKDTLFSPQERLLRGAVEETLHEICRRLGLMWVEAFDIESAGVAQRHAVALRWRAHIHELLRWLDWQQFNRCVPGCAAGEMCYISMDPYPWPEDAPDNTTPRCVSQNYNVWPSYDSAQLEGSDILLQGL
ncbi:hypothetical protein PENSPDRAFT_647468 [Peniophora sp. CONT]|nr:hypothetical protein PENSPDRAFT_647468 [Peniophora sp. CONT]